METNYTPVWKDHYCLHLCMTQSLYLLSILRWPLTLQDCWLTARLADLSINVHGYFNGQRGISYSQISSAGTREIQHARPVFPTSSAVGWVTRLTYVYSLLYSKSQYTVRSSISLSCIAPSPQALHWAKIIYILPQSIYGENQNRKRWGWQV